MNTEQLTRMHEDQGFIAALDQSGGSTPKALAAYGVMEDQYHNDAEMFDLVHALRSRIITSPAFTGERILGAILFEATMDRQIAGVDSAAYLWERKRVVPFLKIDQGLEAQEDGVQLMKAMPQLSTLLGRAVQKGIFGTKMRSVIHEYHPEGIAQVVSQQFALAEQILDAGLMPIIEPEVSIVSTDKSKIEGLLLQELTQHLDSLDEGSSVMLKLTLPEQEDLYAPLTKHSRVVRVVALSGGYSLDESTQRLARNHGVIASFSRVLVEGLSVSQSQKDFDETLDKTIQVVFNASIT